MYRAVLSSLCCASTVVIFACSEDGSSADRIVPLEADDARSVAQAGPGCEPWVELDESGESTLEFEPGVRGGVIHRSTVRFGGVGPQVEVRHTLELDGEGVVWQPAPGTRVVPPALAACGEGEAEIETAAEPQDFSVSRGEWWCALQGRGGRLTVEATEISGTLHASVVAEIVVELTPDLVADYGCPEP